ncbi:hypothetical protein ZTR_04575 [Talaromyces verruculosus]|nr:hypothetical protein ZTR_04575 [Talaromyces verruculosus]
MTDKRKPAKGPNTDIPPTAQTQEQKPENMPSTDQLPENHDTSYGIVDWDGPDDPKNPMNWPTTRKWITISIVSFSTLNVSMASTLFAPGVPSVLQDFHSTNSSLSTLMVSVFIIGFVIGPLVLSPLSEIYGRLPLTHISNVAFLIASIVCAVAVDIPMLIVFRLVMGLAGCVPMTLGGGFVADLMPQEKRGLALNIWTVGPLLGPVIGPVIGGFMAMNVGWRWTFWLEAILGVMTVVACIIFVRETYAPRLLHKKAMRLQNQTGRPMRGKFDKDQTPTQVLATAISRPAKLLIRSPIVALLSFYVSIVYSYMYLLFTTFTGVFEGQYGFNTGEAGLAYLGLGVGFCLGQLTVMPFSSWYIGHQQKLHGSSKPEDRLPPLVLGSCLLPIGLFWYGWSAEAQVYWLVPILGTDVSH